MEDVRNRLVNFILENEVNFLVGYIIMLSFDLGPNSDKRKLSIISDMCTQAIEKGVPITKARTKIVEIIEMESFECQIICMLACANSYHILKEYVDRRILSLGDVREVL